MYYFFRKHILPTFCMVLVCQASTREFLNSFWQSFQKSLTEATHPENARLF